MTSQGIKWERLIIVGSKHHHHQILDYKTDNSHWGSGHYSKSMQGGFSVRSYGLEQPAGVDVGLDCSAGFRGWCVGLALSLLPIRNHMQQARNLE